MRVIRESWIRASSNVNSPLVKTQSGQKTGEAHIYTCWVSDLYLCTCKTLQDPTDAAPRTQHNSFIKLKTETLSTLELNSCYELRLQSIERLMFLGFINYCNTSAVFFFIDDLCFSDEVQCIKSKRSTVSDGLTVGLEKHTGRRKQPMCSNAVSLFPVIAIIICQHPEVVLWYIETCIASTHTNYKKSLPHSSFLVENTSSNNQKEQGIKHDKGGQILLEEKNKKGI